MYVVSFLQVSYFTTSSGEWHHLMCSCSCWGKSALLTSCVDFSILILSIGIIVLHDPVLK